MFETNESNRLTTVVYVLVVVVAVLVGAVLAPAVWSATADSGDDRSKVAVLTLRGGTTDANVNALKKDLREARTDDSVEAVVIRIDSPGGPVDASEEFYLAVNRTAQEMPVVAYVEGLAASGGYYGILPADRIYVKPSSTVGSVGVIVQAPLSAVDQQEEVLRSFIRSGPDKAMVTRDGIRQEMETLQNAFLDSVMTHRGDELTLSRDEVSAADTYLGPEAVRNGFADEIGDIGAAIEYAAAQADGIDGDAYDVVYRELPETGSGIAFAAEDVEEVDGNIVIVDRTDTSDEFVQPVKYYTVWGIPADKLPDEEETEVSTDGAS